MRSAERITRLHRDTILKLLMLAGKKCERVMAKHVRNVKVQDVEVDEVWNFIGKKQKRLRPEDDQNLGDAYVFVGIERNSKLVLNVAIGKRDQTTTNAFIEGLRDAIAPGRFQITSDGFAPYKTAIPDTFGSRVDFAMLIKVYRAQLPKASASIHPPKLYQRRWSQSAEIPTMAASALRSSNAAL